MLNRQLKAHWNFQILNQLLFTQVNKFNKYSINTVKYTVNENNMNMSQTCPFNNMHAQYYQIPRNIPWIVKKWSEMELKWSKWIESTNQSINKTIWTEPILSQHDIILGEAWILHGLKRSGQIVTTVRVQTQQSFPTSCLSIDSVAGDQIGSDGMTNDSEGWRRQSPPWWDSRLWRLAVTMMAISCDNVWWQQIVYWLVDSY